ncbi:MFS transporter [Polaribacter dokdonensis]|uniref:Predicted arabinose efflux permease, MFS family n=2 Tax=Polaribacter dokdonensis DSW-5 TaxID=1300348 RepID=A0A1H5J569_9FLAO|nr:MFS transporter [Polaribacter dokdonensis]SEE47683.1 Predicted arabinose efflux permease, MFS family [Polaribacter dokdonensis DSW-5]
MITQKHILPIIVIAQFCCTSLWFATNGVMNSVILEYQLEATAIGWLTSAVQFGFIAGTLLFALFTISDRFSPSKVFFISALCASLFNFCFILQSNNLPYILIFRFLTGFFLAGIYPVGMKIATDYFDKGLGKSLGFLVGALVLGTALPHLIKDFFASTSWKFVIVSTSILSVIGGLLILLFVKDGPYRKRNNIFDLKTITTVFKKSEFKKAAFGYFGHMWELYTFWAFVPIMLFSYNKIHSNLTIDISLLSFLIIGIGSISCIFAGYISQKLGVRKTAFNFLLGSFVCCLIVPFSFLFDSQVLFVLFLIIWSFLVIGDSPMFSTLVAQNVASKDKGTALTIVNCIGYSITILSILIITQLNITLQSNYIYMLLGLGPFLGLIVLGRKTA